MIRPVGTGFAGGGSSFLWIIIIVALLFWLFGGIGGFGVGF
ncbi:hypothetical protein [Desulfuribacillus stibiiarsenatis]|nr:hypothetical protein [Desulfuribacillus stibiiarsenatis]